MRIEVLAGNEDPIIFPLNSPKVSLGSGEVCDIIIAADGVSRKHLVIICENDNYYVVDQGSTNGSFINEERLIPGRKIEFTSFFPVRLGDNVLISLISDEEAEEIHVEPPVERPQEKQIPTYNMDDSSQATKVISLQSMKQVKTESLVLERNQKRAKLKKKKSEVGKKPKKKKINFVPYFCLALFGLAAYYNFTQVRKEEVNSPVKEIGKIVKVQKKPVKPKTSFVLVSDKELVPEEAFVRLLNDLKCLTDIEKYLCDNFPSVKGGPYGVAQVGLGLNFLVNGTSFFEQARAYVKKPVDDNPELLMQYETLVKDVAVYLYLLRIDKKIDSKAFDGKILSIALFEDTPDGPKVGRMVAIKPEVFKDLEHIVTEQNLRYIRSNGSAALIVTKDYYRTY